jgi:sugar/nucleoside kinase (ribokinase family)
MIPDYLLLGHLAKDLTPAGPRPGGTVHYSALTALGLGLNVAVITACAPEDAHLLTELMDSGVTVEVQRSRSTTTFTNLYDATGNRTQTLSARADDLDLTRMPSEWESASIIHLAPIAGELAQDAPASFTEARILGITPQGWLRAWDAAGKVTQSALPFPDALSNLPSNAVVVLSQEDLGFSADVLASYAAQVPKLVVTDGTRDAVIFGSGQPTYVPAFAIDAPEPTGAGDTFAAALFSHLLHAADICEATRFAHAVATLTLDPASAGARPTFEAAREYLASRASR